MEIYVEGGLGGGQIGIFGVLGAEGEEEASESEM